MAVETEKTAPYGPATTVLQLLRRAHDKGLPEKLTTRELERVGITDDGTARKILRTLRFLKLIDDDGNKLPLFDTFQRASTDEYATVLAGILRDAYEEVFQVIGDPAQASDLDIDNAFRRYDPRSQRSRMVLLFQALLREAKLREGGPVERSSRVKRSSESLANAPKVKSSTHESAPEPSAQTRNAAQTRPTSDANSFFNSVWGPVKQPVERAADDEGYVSLMGGLIRQLPRNRRWTRERRGKWLQAVEVNVDLLVEIVEEEPGKTEQ